MGVRVDGYTGIATTFPKGTMSTSGAASWQRDFGIESGAYPGFVASKDGLATAGLHSHGLRQAFELLELDGVFCSELTPLVYFKEVDAIEPGQALKLHRRFWNHGTAPILVLIAPDRVQVFSGMARPQLAEKNTDRPRCLVDALERAADELQHFLIAVESGAYFREHERSFDADSRVDRDLLTNLSSAREVLRENVREDVAKYRLDALLCGLVFACYLFDREVIGKKYLADLEIADRSSPLSVLTLSAADTFVTCWAFAHCDWLRRRSTGFSADSAKISTATCSATTPVMRSVWCRKGTSKHFMSFSMGRTCAHIRAGSGRTTLATSR